MLASTAYKIRIKTLLVADAHIKHVHIVMRSLHFNDNMIPRLGSSTLFREYSTVTT